MFKEYKYIYIRLIVHRIIYAVYIEIDKLDLCIPFPCDEQIKYAVLIMLISIWLAFKHDIMAMASRQCEIERREDGETSATTVTSTAKLKIPEGGIQNTVLWHLEIDKILTISKQMTIIQQYTPYCVCCGMCEM